MLLCFDHHKLIDEGDVTGHPESRLVQMKLEHEKRIERLSAIDKQHVTHIVRMEASIGGRKGLIDADQTRMAVLPMYPADEEFDIDLACVRSATDGSNIMWELGKAEIDAVVADLHAKVAKGGRRHISIFAIGPMPLLMYLGRSIGDIVGGTAFQRHRDTQDWTFKVPDGTEPKAKSDPPVSASAAAPKDVGVILSISGTIDPAEVTPHLPAGADLYTITVPKPDVNTVRTADQVTEFRTLWRQLLTEIYAAYGKEVRIHVFPAMPVSLCVEFGRVMLPKAEPSIRIYDKHVGKAGGFYFTMTLDSPTT